MGFLALVNAYTMRITLSVAITEMVVKVNNTHHEDLHTCPDLDSQNATGSTHSGTYEWSQELQGVILSSFYWGYAITHLPGGLLAEKFGGKYTLGLGILSTAIFTLLTPVCVEWGTTFPALSSLLAAWIPLGERSKLGSLVFGGGQVGTILGTLISGLLLQNIDGWGSVFYFFGGVALIWVIIFMLICYSDPESHPFISDKEKDFLKKELGQLERDKTLPPTPWKAILTSVPMMALVCAQIGHDWGFYVMVTDLPKYMADVLRFTISENGLYSSLPYLLMWIVSISTGFLSDFLIVRNYLSITNARKVFTAIAAVCPAIFIIGASYAECNRAVVVVMFVFSMGFMGTFYPGMKVNPLDLSPNYAGTLMAITNGIGALTGILSPYIVGVMTPNSSLTEWRAVFWISFGIFVSTTVVYVLWASGEVQPWNYPPETSVENGRKKSEQEPSEEKTDKGNPLELNIKLKS
ncbi:putative inorganic phosphate cotransporter [Pseudolycoriella hygida]|uniref:Inorganic phosphate cotransporter n=1 Tax=Pseudolycoriella hygida TaxID=35572 RepID=A0A9Q0NB62_9DIPT|nr:putative inorganic phosphate cotransporter [Pseudolycoriella hygida]